MTAIGLLISLDKGYELGYLKCTDISSYPISWKTKSFVQGSLGEAIFFSDDNFSTDVNLDFTNPGNDIDPASWVFDVSNFETYTVNTYFLPIWDTSLDLDFSGHYITFYNTGFYINKSVNVKNPTTSLAPDADPDWVLLYVGGDCDLTAVGGANYTGLMEADLKEIFDNAETGDFITGYATSSVLIDTEPFIVTRIDSHEWRITSNIGTGTITEALLTDLEDETIEVLSFSGGVCDLDLSNYGDGIYYIKISYTWNTRNYVAYLVIEDLSDSQECYTALFKYYLCKCADPCDDCDEDMKVKETDLNMILFLITSVKEKVYLEKYQYMGIYELNDSRRQLAEEIEDMIEKLKIIVDRCGLCDEDSTNLIDC